MRVREHFLLGTDRATISVTAKTDCERETLFRHAIESILVRYQEEFGEEAAKTFTAQLAAGGWNAGKSVEWRIRPEDSCWNRADAD